MLTHHQTPEQIADILDADSLFQRLLELDLIEDIDHLSGIVSIRCPLGHVHYLGLSVYVPASVLGRSTAAYRCLHGGCEGRRLLDLEMALPTYLSASAQRLRLQTMYVLMPPKKGGA